MNRKTNKRRVLMCCSDLNTVKGGMVSVVKNLLAFRGWENTEILYIPTHIEKGKFAKTVYFGGACCKVLWQLMFGKVDLLHLHVSERGSVYRKLLLLRLGKLFGKPVILHHHGADFDPFFRSLPQRERDRILRFLGAADTNVVLSQLIRQEFMDRAPGASYTVLYNSVPVPEENRYDPDGNLVVTLGRLGQRKGTYDLLEALAELDSVLPEDIRFCFCGDGETQLVEQRIDEMKLRHRIAHVGWVSGEEKNMLLQKALCHVLPSYREGLPMSILETMALGIPNISTEIASIPEVITSGDQGILIQPGDVTALKTALERICTDRAIRERMSRRSYETVRKGFSSDASGKRLEAIYGEVCG